MAEKRTTYFVAGVLAVACCASAESDLDEYVSSIRRSGMSENAAGSVRMAAGILSGSTTFKATPTEDGSVGRSYSGPPTPTGLTPGERSARTARHEAWIEFLKDQADADNSGFVSTKEGAELRQRVETALLVIQLRPATLDELHDAVHGGTPQIEEDLAAYSAMRAAALKQGLEGMPALPEGLDVAAR